MTLVYAAENLQQAHLLLHLLQHHDVDAILLNQFTHGGVGELPFTHTYPEIWIKHKHQLHLANDIIAEFEQQTVSDVTIYCGKCGESNPQNFESCWCCGTILTD